ncbi:MAG: ribulose-phosphate 3-epimerase [Endomicrobium sp.]|jgi:ribulose-phosphate 3-epimerase|nr:ribulose-phosphate 3-epimerase [Endomicrobium sp.]
MKEITIVPSILSANFLTLQQTLSKIEQTQVKWIHIDIMDGHFVPNLTFGPIIVKFLRYITNLFFDVHLMVTNPEQYWYELKQVGANVITFHNETNTNKKQLIDNIKSTTNIKVGLAISPETNIKQIIDLLPYLDIVLIMTVQPGFGGQVFLTSMISKIEQLRYIINKNKYQCLIEVDGGINKDTAILCINAGANILVSGNYIFSATNITDAIKSLVI